jgi:predicted nucleotidyltransferase component of viral defense system
MFPSKAVFEEVSLKKRIDEAFIEKDWYVIQVIKTLIDHPYQDVQLIFTGGTSLSKAHKLIERFSEDVDFRLTAPSLTGKGPSAVRKTLSDFKNHVSALLGQSFTVLRTDAKNNNRYILVELAYPTVYTPALALRPHIKLEFALDDLLLPSMLLPVSSFVHEVAGEAPEIARIACINPVENATDKLSALIWRIPSRVRGEQDRQPDLVRHLHDLAKLSGQALASPDFASLLHQTVERDDSRAEAVQGLSLSEKLAKVIAVLETDKTYPSEYVTFVQGMSYAKNADVPSFDEALTAVKRLAQKVNRS